MSTLPTFTKSVDDYFVNTWYTVRTQAIDNILNATVVWAALKERGCLKPQIGEQDITRTIWYGTVDPTAISRGDLLPFGEPQLVTRASWSWRWLASYAQRSMFDDQPNRGKGRIRDYVADRVKAMRDGMVQRFETDLFRAGITAETGKYLQSLYDLLPTYATRATGTYGTIARSNSWWQSHYKQWETPYEVNLVSNMNNLYNTIANSGPGQEPPNLIVTDQTTFEIYHDFALDSQQVVRDTGSKLADLGFDVLKFRGKQLVYTGNMGTAYDMMMLNTDYIEFVYDPGYWFEVTDWKQGPLETNKVQHLICTGNLIGTQPRRHGLGYA